MYFTDVGLARPLAHDLVAVPPAGRGVCRICRDLIPPGYAHCRHCRAVRGYADVVVPISLCIRGSALHAALRGYKDGTQQRVRDLHAHRLAALVDDFLDVHEACVAVAAKTRRFDAITVVPSSSPVRDELRPNLRRLAAELATSTSSRHVRLLTATGAAPTTGGFHHRRYLASSDAAGQRILLLEDTWVTGSRAQSAAAALQAAGAVAVAVVAMGRFVNSQHDDNRARLEVLPPWSRDACVLCGNHAT